MAQISKPNEHDFTRLQARPLCILCRYPEDAVALASELGIRDSSWNANVVIEKGPPNVFYFGSFVLGNQKIDYYLSSLPAEKISFAVQATKLFHILRPRYALCVGPCNAHSNPGKSIAIGDVIFGETALVRQDDEWDITESRMMMRSKDGTQFSLPAFVESIKDPRYHHGCYISPLVAPEDKNLNIEGISTKLNISTCSTDSEAREFLDICQLVQVTSLGIVREVTQLTGVGTSHRPPSKNSLQACARAIQCLINYLLPILHEQTWNEALSAKTSPQLPESTSENDPGVQQCHPYYDHFVSWVLDAYCKGQPIRLKANPTIEIKDVRGMKIVMPPALQARFFINSGIFQHVLREFHLQDVLIGQERTKTVSYVAGYMIDFPNTISGFVNHPDPAHQVELFQQTLQSKPYFAEGLGSSLAQICSWKEFLDWLNEADPSMEQMEVVPGTHAALDHDPKGFGLRLYAKATHPYIIAVLVLVAFTLRWLLSRITLGAS